jgi:hypothetical protein
MDLIEFMPLSVYCMLQGLRTIAVNSPGGEFSPLPVPDKPSLSVPFARLFDRILSGTTKYAEKHSRPDSGIYL